MIFDPRPGGKPDELSPTVSVNSRLAELVRGGIQHFILDLDQTLVASRDAHQELLISAAHTAGAQRPEILLSAYDHARGKPYDEILQGTYSALEGGGELAKGTYDAYLASAWQIAAEVGRGDRKLTADVHALTGANDLINELKLFGVPFIIATGSPRPFAEAFLKLSGLFSSISPSQLSCWGDSEFTKRDQQYWSSLLGNIDRNKVVAIDDHPHSAELLLSVARASKVFIVPFGTTNDSADPAIAALASRFPAQVVVLGSIKELL